MHKTTVEPLNMTLFRTESVLNRKISQLEKMSIVKPPKNNHDWRPALWSLLRG